MDLKWKLPFIYVKKRRKNAYQPTHQVKPCVGKQTFFKAWPNLINYDCKL